MEIITCPYCGVEVSMAEVEKEGGACPECGAMITGSLLFDGDANDFDEGEDEEELDDDRSRDRDDR